MRRITPMALFLLVGCISMSADAEKVRVTSNPEVVRACKFLGNVRDDSVAMMGHPGERVEKMLMSKTAKLGGNVLFMTNISSTDKTTSASGEAYSCQ